jgi:hypothetical protein
MKKFYGVFVVLFLVLAVSAGVIFFRTQGDLKEKAENASRDELIEEERAEKEISQGQSSEKKELSKFQGSEVYQEKPLIIEKTVIDENWSTYESEKGFKISFPNDWKYEELAGTNSDPSVISLYSPETLQSENDGFMLIQDLSIYHYSSIQEEPENELNKLERRL